MAEIPDKEGAAKALLLKSYKKKCLLLGTFGWGGFMTIVIFTSIPQDTVRLPWPVLLGIAAFSSILGGSLWGILFYYVSRNGFLKRRRA